jgi:hypothetical protein
LWKVQKYQKGLIPFTLGCLLDEKTIEHLVLLRTCCLPPQYIHRPLFSSLQRLVALILQCESRLSTSRASCVFWFAFSKTFPPHLHSFLLLQYSQPTGISLNQPSPTPPPVRLPSPRLQNKPNAATCSGTMLLPSTAPFITQDFLPERREAPERAF